MSSSDFLAQEINKTAANMIKQSIKNCISMLQQKSINNCYSMLFQPEIRMAMVNPTELFKTIQNYALILKLASLAQTKREETNEQFWVRIFNHAFRDIFDKFADMQSEHLVKSRDSPKIVKRNLEADFQCSNCFKRWDSTHVTVTAHYEVHKAKRNGEDVLLGRITLHEINRQRCQKCIRIFDFPIYTESTASSFAKELKYKVLLKYYGEHPEREEIEWGGKKHKKQPHDTSNCEGCLEEVCISAKGRESFTDPTQPMETERIFNTDAPLKIIWTLEVYGVIFTLGNN